MKSVTSIIKLQYLGHQCEYLPVWRSLPCLSRDTPNIQYGPPFLALSLYLYNNSATTLHIGTLVRWRMCFCALLGQLPVFRDTRRAPLIMRESTALTLRGPCRLYVNRQNLNSGRDE